MNQVIIITPAGRATLCPLRARIIAEFERLDVSLQPPPPGWTPTSEGGAPAVEVRHG